MDKGELDAKDRGNFYAPEPANLLVVEADILEIVEMVDIDILDEELVEALAEMAAAVRNQQTKVAYVVIKITG